MTCITSLVRILPRVQKISLLLEKLCNFFTFSNYYFLPQKTTASQTHFGFTNIGSNMHRFWATAFYFCNFLNGTPCMACQSFEFLGFWSTLEKGRVPDISGNRSNSVFCVKLRCQFLFWLIFSWCNQAARKWRNAQWSEPLITQHCSDYAWHQS